MNTMLKGASKSYTVYAASLLLVLSNIAPLMPAVYAALKLDPQTVQVIGSLGAVLMVVLRTITTQSLADKGAGVPAPAATVVSTTTPGVSENAKP